MPEKNRIIGVTGGLYTVETPNGDVPARSRGVFRQKGIKPVSGDYVELLYEQDSQAVITDVLPRKNLLIRPPLANLDAVLLVASCKEPSPAFFVLDKLTAIFESKGIETVFVFTKTDLSDPSEYEKIYSAAGYKTFCVNNLDGSGTEGLLSYVSGKTTALIGNTGVGKSSLMNRIFPSAEHKTSQISKKLGRGKHTTREVRFYRLNGGTLIADTPGFSTVEVSRYGDIPSEQLAGCFREFSPYIGKCRFKDCAHIKEESCALRQAVNDGEIPRSRYESYCRLYAEAVERENTYE